MIEINELHIETTYVFYLGTYQIIGKYVSRNKNLLMVENAFVYLNGNKNMFLYEESMIIDAAKLINIAIDKFAENKDHSEYYRSYNYNN